MTDDLRRDYRDERKRQFRWKNWMDITTLLAVSLLTGVGAWWFFMIWTDLH